MSSWVRCWHSARPYIPRIYNTEESIRLLATELICMAALCMPLYGFSNCAYFTLRSGGKTFITFLFDSCFTWAVSVPLAYGLSRFTGLNIVAIYLFVNGMDIVKCAIGFVLVKKRHLGEEYCKGIVSSPQAGAGHRPL